MQRQLARGVTLCAVLFVCACNPDGQDASHSDSGSAQAASSATSSSSPPASSAGAPSGTPPVSAGVLDASWVAPTTNTDGSPLTDLAFYRLYYGTASTPCPGAFFSEVASSRLSPQVNEIVTFKLTGLSAGARYFAAITAVDSGGLESGCSPVASAIARSAGGLADLVGGVVNAGANGGSFASQAPALTLTGLTADLRPQVPGTPVMFTATAAGGTAPYEFKWWLWDGTTWTVLGDWSTLNTFAWTPIAPNPSSAVGVWVRSTGNTADQPDGYPTNTGAYGTIPIAIN